MKILQINSVLNTGSTGRIAEDLGLSIIENGFESYIAYGRYARESKSEVIRIGSDFDFKWHGIETRLLDNHGLASRKATKHLLKKIKQIKPDIIHLHNIHGYYLNYQILFDYLSKTDIPIVWTLHDCWAFTGHCAHFSSVKCEKWKTRCFGCPQKLTYPCSFFIDRSTKNWNHKKDCFTKVKKLTLVPVSNWLSFVTKESFLGNCQIMKIGNGVDLQAFKFIEPDSLRTKLRLYDKKVLIGVASVWTTRKGLDDFIAIDRRINHDEYIIILVGLSTKQIESLPSSMIGVTRTESVQELAMYYSLADVCLNLSVEETFGLTTVEAFACGTPGVVYNTTASPELITPETGFIAEQGDLDAVIEAISLITKKGKDFYSSACRKRAEDNYNKDDRYQEYINLYKSLLNLK